jgi:hypothetical protein
MMVRKPWHARWRLHFCEVKLALILTDTIAHRRWIFSDEKKFCLWDEGRGGWLFPDTDGDWPDWNLARSLGMTDAEYIEWRDSVSEHGQSLPKDKSHGKFPVFCWGAVGFNYKSKIMMLEKGTTLTGARYKELLLVGLIPSARRWAKQVRPGPKPHSNNRKPHFLFVQDNDPKHSMLEVREWLEKMNVTRVMQDRLDEDGNQDTFHNTRGPYANQPMFPSFPQYSPDFNMAIEKIWRTLHGRVKNRAADIKSVKDMERVIEEEWDNLAFDRSQYEIDGFIGINALVDMWPTVLQAGVDADGWDTKYMK